VGITRNANHPPTPTPLASVPAASGWRASVPLIYCAATISALTRLFPLARANDDYRPNHSSSPSKMVLHQNCNQFQSHQCPEMAGFLRSVPPKGVYPRRLPRPFLFNIEVLTRSSCLLDRRQRLQQHGPVLSRAFVDAEPAWRGTSKY
jgi:hypothetical protein